LNEEAAAMAKLRKWWIIARLIENAELALDRRALMVGEKSRGGKLKIVERDAAAANRALEPLGRELGMFIERTQDVKDDLASSRSLIAGR
jgi:hypothetical protein